MNNIEKSTFTVTKLTATENFYLTQSTLEEGERRVFTKVAFLAQDQPADCWREATEQEKEEYMSQCQEN